MNWGDLNFKKGGYSPYKVYAQSKLANVMFTRELQERVDPEKVKVVSLHPGVVRTELFRHMFGEGAPMIAYYLAWPFFWYFGKDST